MRSLIHDTPHRYCSSLIGQIYTQNIVCTLKRLRARHNHRCNISRFGYTHSLNHKSRSLRAVFRFRVCVHLGQLHAKPYRGMNCVHVLVCVCVRVCERAITLQRGLTRAAMIDRCPTCNRLEKSILAFCTAISSRLTKVIVVCGSSHSTDFHIFDHLLCWRKCLDMSIQTVPSG